MTFVGSSRGLPPPSDVIEQPRSGSESSEMIAHSRSKGWWVAKITSYTIKHQLSSHCLFITTNNHIHIEARGLSLESPLTMNPYLISTNPPPQRPPRPPEPSKKPHEQHPIPDIPGRLIPTETRNQVQSLLVGLVPGFTGRSVVALTVARARAEVLILRNDVLYTLVDV